MVKKVARMMPRTLKHQKLPVLQKGEAVLIMETACYIINEVPNAADGESLYLSPNYILVPNLKLDSLASATIPLANMNILIQKLKAYHVEINKILEQSFLSDWRRFGPSQLRVHKSKKGVITSERDLVLIRGDTLCDPGKYGLVEKILSPQTLKLRLQGRGEMEKPVGLLIPLIPQCVLKQ